MEKSAGEEFLERKGLMRKNAFGDLKLSRKALSSHANELLDAVVKARKNSFFGSTTVRGVGYERNAEVPVNLGESVSEACERMESSLREKGLRRFLNETELSTGNLAALPEKLASYKYAFVDGKGNLVFTNRPRFLFFGRKRIRVR